MTGGWGWDGATVTRPGPVTKAIFIYSFFMVKYGRLIKSMIIKGSVPVFKRLLDLEKIKSWPLQVGKKDFCKTSS